jgi:Zn-dependent metalloprotease
MSSIKLFIFFTMHIPAPSIPFRKVFILFIFVAYTLLMGDKALAQPRVGKDYQTPMTSILAFPEDTKIRFKNSQGTITFLHAKNLSKNLEKHPKFHALQATDELAQIALAFVRAYKNQFSLLDPDNELIISSINHDELGYKQIRFRQVYLTIPVWGAEILVQLDSGNHVTLVNGHYLKTPVGIKTQPNLTQKHIFEIVANQFGINQACKNCKLQTVIYTAENKNPRLAFQVSVSISLTEGWEVIVDASTGLILNKISTVYSAT